MKKIYICDVCGKQYNTETDAVACEEKHKVEQEKARKLKEERGVREAEIQKDLRALNEKIRKYNEDYGTYRGKLYPDSLAGLITLLFKDI